MSRPTIYDTVTVRTVVRTDDTGWWAKIDSGGRRKNLYPPRCQPPNPTAKKRMTVYRTGDKMRRNGGVTRARPSHKAAAVAATPPAVVSIARRRQRQSKRLPKRIDWRVVRRGGKFRASESCFCCGGAIR